MSGSAEVSVIVPFRHSADHLASQLEALAAQEFEGSWEVVAVDNASTDGSRRIAERFRRRLSLVVVDAFERSGAGYARNVGAAHASGDKLLFVDADDEVAPGYLAAMAAGLDRHEFVTSAFDHCSLNPEWVRSAYGPVWRDPADPLPSQWGVLPFAGGSIGITRRAFDKAGGFPEDLPRMQDIAFSWEVQFAGAVLGYVSDAVYRVRYRNTLTGLFRQGLAGGSTAPLLYRRYRAAGMPRRSVPEVATAHLRTRRQAAAAAVVAQMVTGNPEAARGS
jgi:glycosyltransferase involved in cell wall biosynthesis